MIYDTRLQRYTISRQCIEFGWIWQERRAFFFYVYMLVDYVEYEDCP